MKKGVLAKGFKIILDGAIELKEHLSEKGFDINHIYTGFSTPIIIDNGNSTVGAGNIRAMYRLY
jgi:hypothetical protein